MNPSFPMAPMIIFYFIILMFNIEEIDSSCSSVNYCSGHGKCPVDTCECYPGWGAAEDITTYRSVHHNWCLLIRIETSIGIRIESKKTIRVFIRTRIMI